MNLTEMLNDLPKACNVGTKKNSKGYKSSWTGYKLHIDAAGGSIPISCILTSASSHDIPGTGFQVIICHRVEGVAVEAVFNEYGYRSGLDSPVSITDFSSIK
jgi:hypothetical protein